MISGPVGNCRNDELQTLKADLSISYFEYPKNQMGINSLIRTVQFQNFNPYKWENV